MLTKSKRSASNATANNEKSKEKQKYQLTHRSSIQSRTIQSQSREQNR